MSVLNYRRIEKITLAGLSVATFLSDDRDVILVSVSDLTEQLALQHVDLPLYDEYVAYLA